MTPPASTIMISILSLMGITFETLFLGVKKLSFQNFQRKILSAKRKSRKHAYTLRKTNVLSNLCRQVLDCKIPS